MTRWIIVAYPLALFTAFLLLGQTLITLPLSTWLSSVWLLSIGVACFWEHFRWREMKRNTACKLVLESTEDDQLLLTLKFRNGLSAKVDLDNDDAHRLAYDVTHWLEERE